MKNRVRLFDVEFKILPLETIKRPLRANYFIKPE
jgi:hypothetical protein